MSEPIFYPYSDDAVLPIRGTKFSAGVDIAAARADVVPARGSAMVATDLGVHIPTGYYGWITSRSGLAKVGIVVEAGIIDSDYDGAIWVILYNHTDTDYQIRMGHRIAQMIIQPCLLWNGVRSDRVRGEDGFGSTG